MLRNLAVSASLEGRLAGLKQAIDNHISGALQFDDITWVGIERTG